jgi:hypothetical protein
MPHDQGKLQYRCVLLMLSTTIKPSEGHVHLSMKGTRMILRLIRGMVLRRR